MSQQLLNPHQHKFVRGILKGLTQAEAYKAAGYKAKSRAVADTNAARLIRSDRISAALASARAAPMAAAQVTVDTIVAELEEARQGAQMDGQWAAAVAASGMKARVLGLVIEKRQVDVLHHKPALHSQALELSIDEWQRQFAPGAGRESGGDQPALPAKTPMKPTG
jgi:phage terminase small subunit